MESQDLSSHISELEKRSLRETQSKKEVIKIWAKKKKKSMQQKAVK